jgi:lactoylglutathione lyase
MKTGHIGLNVTDVPRSADFYRRVLELDLLRESAVENRRYAFLGRDGTLVLTLWQQSEGRYGPATPGLHHLSFQVPDLTDVYAVEQRAKELGATMLHDGAVAHGEGAASGGVFFTDPDGMRLEVFAASGAHGLPVPASDAPTCGLF